MKLSMGSWSQGFPPRPTAMRLGCACEETFCRSPAHLMFFVILQCLYCHCRRSFYSAVSSLSLQAQVLFCSVVTVIAGAAFILQCLHCHCRRSFYSQVSSLSLQAQLLFCSVVTVIAGA